MSGEMKMFTEASIDEIYTIIYSDRHLKGKMEPFIKKILKFTSNPRKIRIFRLITT
jgi:hypothetical protein